MEGFLLYLTQTALNYWAHYHIHTHTFSALCLYSDGCTGEQLGFLPGIFVMQTAADRNQTTNRHIFISFSLVSSCSY